MGVQKKKLRSAKRKKQQAASYRRYTPEEKLMVKNFTPIAPAHAALPNSNVHVFVDDQNIFWFGRAFHKLFHELFTSFPT